MNPSIRRELAIITEFYYSPQTNCRNVLLREKETTVTHTEILDRLKKIIGQVVGNDQITLNSDTTADEVPGWDSFNHINIIMGVEMEFGIRFNVAELESLKNVGDFTTLIEKRLANKK